MCPTPLQASALPSSMQRTLALQLAVKCADLGHMASSWPIHQAWVDRLQQELYSQGDLELAHSLPTSPMCDRNGACLRDGQVGFIDGVVVPMMWSYLQVFPQSAPQLLQTLSNRQQWAALSASQQQQQQPRLE